MDEARFHCGIRSGSKATRGEDWGFDFKLGIDDSKVRKHVLLAAEKDLPRSIKLNKLTRARGWLQVRILPSDIGQIVMLNELIRRGARLDSDREFGLQLPESAK
jgi:hypothetical protein